MGKNKNHNKRKKNNVLVEPNKEASGIQVNFSTPKKKNYNPSRNTPLPGGNGKKEISINIKCTVEFPEIVETQNKLNSLSISDSGRDRFSSEPRKTYTELRKIAEENLEPNLTRKAPPLFETNYNEMKIFLESNNANETHRHGSYKAKKPKKYKSKPFVEKHPHVKETQVYNEMESFMESNNTNGVHLLGGCTKKAQPNVEYNSKPFVGKQPPVKETQVHNERKQFMENNTNGMLVHGSCAKKAQRKIEYKSKPVIEKHPHVQKTEALVKKYHVSTACYSDLRYGDETVGKTRYRCGPSEKTSNTSSVPKMQGARPKTETKFRNSALNDNFKIKQNEKDSQLFRHQIQGGVKRYENNWDNFDRRYHSWLSQRKTTIEKLQELVKNVHEDQRMFNKGRVTLKELNVVSRLIKNGNSSPAIDLLASFGACVTDGASSITSAIQAYNADGYTAAFKEIMENDAKVTKPLYAARSQCLEEYRNVEEIIRQCHLETFGSTIDNISNTLNVEDLLSDLQNVKGENTIGQVFDSVGDFLKKNANMEVMGEVCSSIQDYLDSNPAVLEACKSAGKTLYGVYDTWGRDHRQGRGSITGNMSITANNLMLTEERKELIMLRCVADNDDANQAKLESEIHGAISSLQSEMTKMNHIFERRDQNQNSNHW